MPLNRPDLRKAMLEIAKNSRPNTTFCPSEVPRSLSDDESVWRPQMEATREVARELARQGKLEILQKGVVKSPDEELRGPIRLRRPPSA